MYIYICVCVCVCIPIFSGMLNLSPFLYICKDFIYFVSFASRIPLICEYFSQNYRVH